MKKLDNIELVLGKEEDGVFAISFVENPAIEEDFVYLSSMEINLSVTDSEKREVIGLALVPDKRIYRRVKDKEFNVWFSAETIKKTAELFMERLMGNNATTEHAEKAPDISVIESWIVEDEKHDKSNIYKLNAPKGSWVIKTKVNNNDVWDSIKLGKYKGYSVEAKYSGMEEILSAESNESEADKLLKGIEQIIKDYEQGSNS